jgi:hypothetical protein
MSYGWLTIEKNPTWRGIQRVRQLTTLVVVGKKAMQMFCSLPGLGKTETVLKVFKEFNLPPHYCSPLSAGTFCTDLWQHRNRPYFLDDCDILARSEPCANIGKMAWGPQRLVVCPLTKAIQQNEDRRLADSDKYNPNIPPPTFRVGQKHGVIWNTNKDFTDPRAVAGEMAADFAALVSRGLDPFKVPGEPQSVFDYTVWMILAGMLRRHPQGDFRNDRGGFRLAIQQEVLDFMCTHGRRLKEISPRMAYKLAAARRDDPSWEQAWEEQLAPKALWQGLMLPDDLPRLWSPAMKYEQERALEPPEGDAVTH